VLESFAIAGGTHCVMLGSLKTEIWHMEHQHGASTPLLESALGMSTGTVPVSAFHVHLI
jgi:hypothetical protein